MGENEQSGMLKTIIVVGLIAILSFAVIAGVVALKATSAKNTEQGVGVMVTTAKPYDIKETDTSYVKYDSALNTTQHSGWGANGTFFPIVGDIPVGNWREDRITLQADHKIFFRVDIGSSFDKLNVGYNDNDDTSKRSLAVYKDGKLVQKITSLYSAINLEANTTYTIVVKYYNGADAPLIEKQETGAWMIYRVPQLITGTTDGSAYRLQITDFEAATYSDKYKGYSFYQY